MGWRGLVKALVATSRHAARERERSARAYERAQQRRYREVMQQLAVSAKLDGLRQAAAEAEAFQTRVAVLRSVHSESLTPIDWNALFRAPAPAPPVYTNQGEVAALYALQSHRPGILSNALGHAQAERAQLEVAVEQARRNDAEYNHRLHASYLHAHQMWDWLRRVAYGVLSGDIAAYRAALDWRDVFGELEELGSSAKIETISPAHVEVDLFVNSDEVIPREVKTLTSTGKLSVKKMTLSQANDIYQDYVCSSALRVAREVCATVPVQIVLVHAIGELLNSSTGHMESEAILSVAMPRATLERLNFDAIDASDSMRNFVHRMKFQKTKGFLAVEPLSLAELQAGTATPSKMLAR